MLTANDAAPGTIPPGDLDRGVYDTSRAAALAGVPASTLHRWARQGLYVPSVAAEPRVRLWSWGDLLALRAIDWFRRTKDSDDPPPVSVRKVRPALEGLDRAGVARRDLYQVLAVTRDGQVFIARSGEAARADAGRQGLMPAVLELVRPYHGGPDLLQPRPLLRIIPGKLHGKPHIVDTRIPTAALYSLLEDGYTLAQIDKMYPDAEPVAIAQAIEFERSLPRAS